MELLLLRWVKGLGWKQPHLLRWWHLAFQCRRRWRQPRRQWMRVPSAVSCPLQCRRRLWLSLCHHQMVRVVVLGDGELTVLCPGAAKRRIVPQKM